MATTKHIGRVGLVMQGEYNAGKSYSELDCVKVGNFTYVAKKKVPAGISITNSDYWQVLTNAGAGPDASFASIYQFPIADGNGNWNWQNADKTLTKEGAPADAKTTGDCIKLIIQLLESTVYLNDTAKDLLSALKKKQT